MIKRLFILLFLGNLISFSALAENNIFSSLNASKQDIKYQVYIQNWKKTFQILASEELSIIARKYGREFNLHAEVALNSNGEIDKVKIHRGSGNAEIDEAFKRIVINGAPYEKFSDPMKKEIDILHMTNKFIILPNRK